MCIRVVATLLAFAATFTHSIQSQFQIEPVSSPAAMDSGQPQLTSSKHGVILSWIEREGDAATLKFSIWRGGAWSEPRVVARGTNWFVNWADVPSVMRLSDGRLAAHWLQKNGTATYAYDVRLSFSPDDGKTWSPPVLPHHDGTQTEHGFASLFNLPDNSLGLVWLDGREMVGGHGKDGHAAGVMTLRSASFDATGRQKVETSVNPRVCECCPTAAAATDDGIVVAYRHRDQNEVRDIYVSRYERGVWTGGTRVHPDNWRIPACPVNGPALAAEGRRVAIAWFTMRDEDGRAFAAFSEDAGRTFGSPIRLDDRRSMGRVDIELLPDGSAAAGYIELAQSGPEFRLRRVERSGTRGPAVTIAALESGRASGYPRVALGAEDLVFAWVDRDGQSMRVRTAAARLPSLDQRIH